MPGEFDDAVNKALDEYELMRRKAAAWDELRKKLLSGDKYCTVEDMDRLMASKKDPR